VFCEELFITTIFYVIYAEDLVYERAMQVA